MEYRAEVLRAYLGDGAPDGKPSEDLGEVKPANLRAACAEPVEIKDFGVLFGS